MRKKEFLIPKEKKKKIIYLDRRGREEEKHIVPAIIFGILGGLCILYCICIGFFMSFGTKFFFVWGLLGLLLGLLSYLMLRPDILKRIPKWFRMAFVILCIVGIILLAVVEGMIVGSFGAKASGDAGYCIVLGAQWKNNGPSYVLKKRLDKALEYLRENEGTMVVVSGGQGSNEPIREGDGMKQYLLDAGIAEDRIIVENESMNTYQNLLYSKKLLDAGQDRVVLVTNNFHVFRACAIARKMGYARVEGLAAGSYPAMLPNNMLREFFGVLKDFVVGHI